MSKKQDKLTRQSEVEASWYDSLNADKKRAYTRHSTVSCKRVEKDERNMFTLYGAMETIMRKGGDIDNLTIDFSYKRRDNDVIGLGTKAKIAFLVKHHGFTVRGL